jgi:mannose-6-phosphate isomerase-like protein (cupin superfamily)
MFTLSLEECEEFISGDGAHLRELLHPDKAPLELRYSLAHAIVEPGSSTAPHRLRTSEVYYLLSGTGRMSIEDEMKDVGPQETVYIPPGAIQYITNTGVEDLVFLCIVDPAWRPEDEEILLRHIEPFAAGGES